MNHIGFHMYCPLAQCYRIVNLWHYRYRIQSDFGEIPFRSFTKVLFQLNFLRDRVRAIRFERLNFPPTFITQYLSTHCSYLNVRQFGGTREIISENYVLINGIFCISKCWREIQMFKSNGSDAV